MPFQRLARGLLGTRRGFKADVWTKANIFPIVTKLGTNLGYLIRRLRGQRTSPISTSKKVEEEPSFLATNPYSTPCSSLNSRNYPLFSFVLCNLLDEGRLVHILAVMIKRARAEEAWNGRWLGDWDWEGMERRELLYKDSVIELNASDCDTASRSILGSGDVIDML
jgi:hypothetical protein